jgi:hypothetical protein
MSSGVRSRLTFANVTSVTALVFAMGGGAYALSGIPDHSGVFHGCVNNRTGALRVVKSVTSCRHRRVIRHAGKRRVIPGELAIAWNQTGVQGVRGLQGPPGQKGDGGSAGTPGAPGAAGAAGTARAYGLISSGPTVSRSKNIVGVTNPSTGIWCVQLAAGIDASSTGAVVGPDHATDSTLFGSDQPQAIAEWRSDGADCPAGQIDVVTGVRSVAGSAPVQHVNNTLFNEDFFIVVP